MLCIIPVVLQGLVLVSMIQTCVICMFKNNDDEQIENQHVITEV
jgi:hypothetical protein